MASTWVPVPEGSDFPIENLPYGVAADVGAVVAIGDHALPLARALADPERWEVPSLNRFLAAGRPTWRRVRAKLTELLTDPAHRATVEPLLIARADLAMVLPIEVADYVDFYSSIHHATNLGRLFRPDAEPLLPNWRHLPVGYHGRAGTVVVSGTPIRRPRGHTARAGETPRYGPSDALDIELELATVIGVGSPLGEPIAVAAAGEHIFGFALLNDWSARDIQSFEYQPLGPFLGKSFATTLAPWIVTTDALAPHLVAGPRQDPRPAPHLRPVEPWGIDVELRAGLTSGAMRAAGTAPTEITAVNFAAQYWTPDQQLAHLTANGASTRTGDLLGSGTVSGPGVGSEGSLIERTRGGARSLRLPDGSERTYLQDGDEVTLTGWCGGGGGDPHHPRIGFGTAVGRVVPAL